ncbi:sensor histidine kinase [Thermomonospora sp. CIF 1]|uniref:sensor histidine kinase n=1 Tax=Thermomonospora sp. CIF 1 TaxID=1916083 RepID=UPI000B00F49B|nr:sensor histidine kinase [Thermomonospora sp. CIF 1]PKK13514.1 MAG: sensor [Thermomonospora sp. CIF 1]
MRSRIALLLVIPLLSLITLWGFAASLTLSGVLAKRNFNTLYDRVGTPSAAVAQVLEGERAAAAALMGDPSTENTRKFQEESAKLDAIVARFRNLAFSKEARDAVDEDGRRGLAALNEALDTLGTLRSQVRANAIDPVAAVDGYSRISDAAYQLLLTISDLNEVEIQRNTAAVMQASMARDMMLRQDALLAAVPADGRLTGAQRTAFARWAGSRAQFMAMSTVVFQGELQKPVQRLIGSPEFERYQSLEAGVVSHGVNTSGGVRLADWKASTAALAPMWWNTIHQTGEALNKRTHEIGDQIQLRFYLAGGVGLLAVIAAVTLSVLFTRSVSGELRRLQQAAYSLAHERLPRVVARLRRGEEVDVAAEAPRLEAGRTREIAEVADAFAVVQRTAIQTAVGEAELRKNINRVFINLSWRSQSLLQRQLKLLDTMERRASSPEELDDLFKLDHLTTRMRRHAEGLVILAGSPTVRAWDHPVPAEDVVRAAIAEVEDYTRVDAVVSSTDMIAGAVVADVIHLLAELIENATIFSPPTTEVVVRADAVANGLAVEIIDRGIGMHPEQLAELNQRLADPPEFDLADTEQLGLFVVARLAVRHGIKVSLQPSPYGGTTAVVLIPGSLVVSERQQARQEPVAVPAGPEGARQTHHPQPRHAPSGRLGRPVRDLPGTGPLASGGRHAAGRGGNGGHISGDTGPIGEATGPIGIVPATGPVEQGTGPLDVTPTEGEGPLPRRRRQENLVPQLRRDPSPQMSAAMDEEDFDEPSPEYSRDLMSSLQAGWMRGRDDDEETPDLDQWNERG